MAAYILKRIALILPTLFFISLIAFGLSKITPQDPVNSVLSLRGVEPEGISDELYDEVYKKLGQDKPIFYFSIVPSHYPETRNYLSNKQDRELYNQLLEYGIHYKLADGLLSKGKAVSSRLRGSGKSDSLLAYERSKTSITGYLNFLNINIKNVEATKFFTPSLRWHGFDNQYQYWLDKIFTKGFGPSLSDGKASIYKVAKAMQWTLSFTLVDLLLSVILGIYLGIYLNLNPKGKGQRLLRQVLYFFYAMPVFWLATMAVVYFTTDDYGSWTNLFPSVGMNIYPGKATYQQIFLNAEKLILPILCLTLHSLAYVTRMVENSLQDEIKKDYVLMAMAMGLQKKKLLTDQVLKNAMIPSITLFVAAFAGAFSGSLVLEVIFNIPGMGRLLFNALMIADWNVVFCILLVLSFITIIAYLIGDILYARFNPKIRFTSK